MSDSVIIIGAGISGLSLAALLADSGREVLVLEKNSYPGGRCSAFPTTEGSFDTGATMFMMRESYRELFDQLGEKLEDHLSLKQLDNTARICFDEGSRLDLTADDTRMSEQLETFEKGSFTNYQKFISTAGKYYSTAVSSFVRNDFSSTTSMLSPRRLFDIISSGGLQRLYPHVSRYFKDPRLRAAFSYPSLYIGMDPCRTPAMYSLLSYMEIKDGSWQPTGGMAAVSHALEKIAISKGAKIRYNTTVERLNSTGKKINSAVLSDGSTETADWLTAACDLPYVYDKLLPPEAGKSRYLNKKYSAGAVIFYWTLKQTAAELNHPNMVFLRDSFPSLTNGHTGPDFYLNLPDGTEDTGSGRRVMAVVPCANTANILKNQWPQIRDKLRQAVLRRLDQEISGDFSALILSEHSLTPLDFKTVYNISHGACFGSLDHGLLQQGAFRGSRRHRKYKNLYFCGSCTHPGSGVPMVIHSALQTYRRMLADAGGAI